MKKGWIEIELRAVCDPKGGGTLSKSNMNYWCHGNTLGFQLMLENEITLKIQF